MAIRTSDDSPRERRLFLILDCLNCFQRCLWVVLVLSLFGWGRMWSWSAGLVLLMLAYDGYRFIRRAPDPPTDR